MPPDIFVDAEGRIMESEEDFFKVFNKAYSYQTFLFTQKPLFLELVRAFRKKERICDREDEGSKEQNAL